MGAGYTFYFKEEIFMWLLAPAGDHLSPFDGKPTYSSPMGMMGATITVVSKGALLGALPVAVYSVLTMIRPWLPPRFWRFTVYLTLATTFSYLTGIAFVYYVMLPVGLGFLLNFGSNIAVALIDIGEYLKLLTALMFAMGLVFLIPVLMFLLAKMRIVKYKHWRWGRMVVPIFAGFLGIILTPTADGINFLMVSLPVMGLYEIGLFVTWVIAPEEGNYLFLRTIGQSLGKVWRFIASPLRGVRWIRHKLRDNNKAGR